ncbi:MAG TPA: TetR/AcrR family transcriptional regulator [Solirubrobacteraceae bacterium]|jgi:AcrR family transcriptional regulator|nr:TetR/AcrR family transcriptional regulator [Solirubrobacteraceae bacterium]
MAIPSPPTPTTCWSALNAQDKRSRLLRAAGEVFARDGLDAPMPAVATAACAGIGSVYRQFPSKHDLLAALVIERLQEVRDNVDAALTGTQRPWAALTGLLWTLVERQSGDDVLSEAIATLSANPAVQEARATTVTAMGRLLAAAQAEGRARADATTLDLQLLFAATAAAAQLSPGAWRRMLELGIDALAARPPNIASAPGPQELGRPSAD